MRIQAIKDKLGDIANKIDELKAVLEAEGREPTAEEYANLKTWFSNRDELKEKLEVAQRLAAENDEAEPQARGVEVIGPAAEQSPYKNIGEYLQDIAQSTRNVKGGRAPLPRVVNYQQQVQAAATGAGEDVPADGGYLVGTDFASGLMSKAYDNSQVISRCTQRTITGTSNAVEMNGVDETSRANGSRHGGIRFYWLSEAETMTASKPTFRKVRLELKDGGVLFYATNDLLQDSTLLSQEINDAVPDEIAFAIQEGIINGTGAGQPQGILNSPALVSQAKESGQAAATIVYENVLKMLTRKWGALSRYVWLYNQEILPQLATMNVAVGTGGAPVYLPSGGASDAPFQTLFTRPLIEIEQASALGTAGDLILADLSQYVVAEKGGVQAAMSIHVEFLTNQTVFRWIIRVDGQSTWNSALTPYKGSATRSPFVALATRS